MSIKSPRGIFPWFTVIEGIAGFFMQCWLFTSVDENGLLPPYHMAGILSFVLLAMTLVICWFGSREEADLCPDRLFFSSMPAAIGVGLSAAGMAFSAFVANGKTVLQMLTFGSGLLAAAALGYIAICRARKFHADAMLHCIITAYLILRTMASCSTWTTEPQFTLYFFPLLACVFLMITSYYRSAMALGLEHSKKYVFFSQAALFCCLVCCRGEDWVFYLSGALWLTFDCPAPSTVPKGRFTKE